MFTVISAQDSTDPPSHPCHRASSAYDYVGFCASGHGTASSQATVHAYSTRQMFGEHSGKLFMYNVLSLRNSPSFSGVLACTYMFNIKYDIIFFIPVL